MSVIAKQWVLARRPEGLPVPEDFRLESFPVPELEEGEFIVRIEHFSVDPGMRSRLTGDSYAQALPIGATIESATIGIVEHSLNPRFLEGDRVTGGFGWVSHAVSNGRGVQGLDRALYSGAVRPTAAIGILGIPGLTSYFGLLDIGQPKQGETVLVSSAAGPVGATAGQIARLKGCRVVGIAGGAAKGDYVRSLGFDACIDYQQKDDIAAAIRTACPEGVDIYFDNVGGEMLDAALLNMNPGGRIVVSGQVSEYNREPPLGIRNVPRFITHRLRMEGLVVYDYIKRFTEARTELAGWIRSGELSYAEDVSKGIEGAPDAFIGLFKGRNNGRRLIRVS